MAASVWGGRRVQALTRLVLATKGRTCHLCGLTGATTADHVTPRSKGGAVWDLANLEPAHYGCNSARGDMDLDAWFAKHPRRTTPALTPSRDW